MKRKQLFILVLSVLFISCTKMENDVILLVPYSQQEEIMALPALWWEATEYARINT